MAAAAIAVAVAVLTRSALAKTVVTTEAIAMVVAVMAEAVVAKTARGVVVTKARMARMAVAEAASAKAAEAGAALTRAALAMTAAMSTDLPCAYNSMSTAAAMAAAAGATLTHCGTAGVEREWWLACRSINQHRQWKRQLAQCGTTIPWVLDASSGWLATPSTTLRHRGC